MDVKESTVMTRVSSMIAFIKSETKNDLITAKQQGMIDIEFDQIEKLCNVIDSSISKNFIKSSNELTRLFSK